MTTVYCTSCWATHAYGTQRCARCGAPLQRPPTYVAGLIVALGHPEPSTPVRAATLLGQVGAREAVDALRSVLRTRDDPHLLEAATIALGTLGDRAAIPELIQVLHGGPIVARRAAVEALRRLQGIATQAALAEAARQDPNQSVREAATKALESLDIA